MHFDVVIGNPPYNNDLYVDFVELGTKLSKEISTFITPSKWQAKGGEKNKRFRENIVQYMNKIVVYKDSTEIFDIEEWGGICYYIITKKPTATKLIKNICKRNNSLSSNFEPHNETNIILYNIKILQIIRKVQQYKNITDSICLNRQVYVNEQDRGEQTKQEEYTTDYIEVMQGELLVGYKKIYELYTQKDIEKYKCICSIMSGSALAFDSTNKVLGIPKMSILKPYQVPKGSFPILKYFTTEQECNSFVSYMNTHLISFLYYLGCCGTTMTKEFFRFIPNQEEFNHIFTNEELYKRYDITQEEINIIESIIKEREQGIK
jgi:site-specific DNA-methyltransferase (adenine-specific)